jgi:hypothetical protein
MVCLCLWRRYWEEGRGIEADRQKRVKLRGAAFCMPVDDECAYVCSALL